MEESDDDTETRLIARAELEEAKEREKEEGGAQAVASDGSYSEDDAATEDEGASSSAGPSLAPAWQKVFGAHG